MLGGPSIGTAYLRVAGDFSQVNSQLVGLVSSRQWSKHGKLAGAALAGGVAAAGAAKALYEVGQAFDEASDKIRIRTGATGKHLKRLEGDFKNVVSSVPTDFDSASTAIAGLNQRLDLTGKPLRRLSKQVTEFSRITDTDIQENVESITRLFGDWSIKTGKQTKTLDAMFRVTQETGIQLSDLSRLMVQFGSPLRQLGLDFETSAAMFARFEKEGVNIQTLMPGLRFALKTFSGATPEVTAELKKMGVSLKDPSAALQDVFGLIEKAPTDLKANAIAFQVFGQRAGPDMAAAVREGRFELDELMKTVATGDETVRKAGRQTMDFSEQWLLLKNNLAVALEPAARKVFDEVGDLMGRITDVVRDKDISVDEKIDKIGHILGKAVERNVPKIAEAGGKIGLALIKGTFNAFMESGLLGKLFIGGSLLRMFGGVGVFKSAGSTIASSLGGGIKGGLAGGALTAVGTVAAVGIADALSHEFKERSGPLADQLAASLDTAWHESMIDQGLEIADFIDVGDVGEKLLGADFSTLQDNEGLRFLKQYGEDLTKLTQKQRDAFRAQVKGLEASGQIEHAEAKSVLADIRAVDEARRKAERAAEEASARGRGFGFAQAIAQDGKVAGNEVDKMLREMRRLPKGARDEAADMMIGMAKTMEEKGRLPEGSARRLRKAVVNEYGDMNVKSVKESADMARGLVANAQGTVNVVSTALGILGKNTNKALKAYGVKEITFDLLKAGGKSLLGGVFGSNKNQRGGPITDGQPTGDSVPAMLERGEYVLNREAVKRLGLPTLDRINFENAPRFQGGGIVPVPGFPGERMNSAVIPAHEEMVKQFKLFLTDAFGSGHASPEHTQYGTAADYVPGSGGSWGLVGNAVAAAVRSGYNPVGYDGSGGSENWPDHGPGNHAHITYLTVAELLAGKKPGGGALGAVAQQISRLLLKGPDGPLKDMGQSSMDQVRDAANDFLSQQSGGASFAGMSGPWVEVMKKIAEQHGWSFADWMKLVQGESGGDPAARNSSSGAFGLGQFLGDTAQAYAKYGALSNDPAKQIVAMAKYISDRYGDPTNAYQTWLSRSPHWYAKGGLVGQIKDLYGELAGLGGKSKKGKGKQRGQAVDKINDKIKDLSAKLRRRQRRGQKHKLHRLKDKGALGFWGGFVNEWTDKVTIQEDVIARLETRHEGTIPPDSLTDAMSMLGLTLGPDAEWEGLDPTTQGRITDLLGVEFGREQQELTTEVAENEKLLRFVLNQRNMVVGALRDAEETIARVSEAIERQKKAKREAEQKAEAIEHDIRHLQRRLEQAKSPAQQRELRARIQAKQFTLGQRRQEAQFAQQQIEMLTGMRSDDLQPARDDFVGTLDELQGPGGPTKGFIGTQAVPGIIDALPALTEGAVPRFGGKILDIQAHLRDLGATKIIRPDFTSPDAAIGGAGDSELLQLKLEQALNTIKNQRVELLQRPVFEDYLQRRQVPMFHEGGVMPGSPHEEYLAFVKGQETVRTPEQEAALGGGDIYLLVDPMEGAVREISREEANRSHGKRLSVARRTVGAR